MKRISDNYLTMLLPLTVVAATAFGLVAAIAFRMGATTAGFVFATLSIAGWIGLVAEFFLLYDIIIDKWLAKDRSVLTASWFVLSLLLIDPTEYLDSVGDFINALGNGFAEEPLTSFLICLYTLTLFAGLQIFLYFVISLSNCFKHKVLVGFAIIFACNMLSSMISNLAGDLSLWNMLFMPTSRLPDTEVAFNLRLVFMTMYQFAYILAYFLLTNFIITRKHNLQ